MKHTQNGTSAFGGFSTVKLNNYIPVNKGDIFRAVIKGVNVPLSINTRVHNDGYTSFISAEGKIWNASENIVCLKIYTTANSIKSSDLVKYYKNASGFSADVNVANANVTFSINGINYTKTTDEKGTAYLNINLRPGTYNITTFFNGINKTNTVTVLSTITGDNLVKYYKNGTEFYAKFVKGNGEALANRNVTFNINGVFYTRETDSNGIAKLNIKLYPNNYIITSSYNGLEVSNRINVSSSNTTIIGKDAHVIMDSINSNYTVTLVDVKGNPIGNKTVYFRYDNKQVTATTDKNGNATITISGLKNGDYNITYGFDGVEGYCSSSSSSILHVVNSTTILTGNDLTMVYNDGSEFKVKLTDLYGKPLANKIITFVINGIAYNRTTDSNGVAS